MAATTAVGSATSPSTHALGLVTSSRQVLAQAIGTREPGERFRLAHLSALRTAAALVALAAQPQHATARRRRLMSVWVLLERLAPEHAEWARYFAAGAAVRAAVEAGAWSAASARDADDQVRAAGEFLDLAERSLGLLAA